MDVKMNVYPEGYSEPKYEIWGGWNDDIDYGGPAEFFEDCFTLDDAREGVRAIVRGGYRYAYVVDKDTGATVKDSFISPRFSIE